MSLVIPWDLSIINTGTVNLSADGKFELQSKPHIQATSMFWAHVTIFHSEKARSLNSR